MKTFIVGLVMLVSANVQANVFLSICNNYARPGNAVGFSYQSCINRNFREIDRAVEGSQFFSHCSNSGDEVRYFFTSCVQRNFREVERVLRESNVFLRICTNFSKDKLDYSFQSCVNSNYRTIERALR